MANPLKNTAEQLLAVMDQESDKKRDELLSSINKHSLVAVGAGLIPLPLADIATATVNIWHMYIDINKILGISFKDNLTKSIASAAIANLSGNILGVSLLSLLKIVPGANIAATVVVAATNYAICTSSAWIYLHALTTLSKEKVNYDDADEVEKILKRDIKDNKKGQKDIAKESKAEYIKNHKDDK